MSATAKRSRFGLSLGTRIFLLTALLIVISVGAAVGVTYWIGNGIADAAVKRSLAANRSVLNDVRNQRFQQLELISQLFSRDSPFISYIVEATGGSLLEEDEEAANIDTRSILDLLAERQSALGFEFAMVLDPDGFLIARTDQPDASGEDLSETALVTKLYEQEGSASGFWLEGRNLYQAVAVPLVQQFDLYGILIAGFAVDEGSVREIERVSGTDLAILVRDQSAGPGAPLFAIASTLDVAESDVLVRTIGEDRALVERVVERGEPEADYELELGPAVYKAYVTPLEDASGNVLGATIGLTSLDEALASYRRIQQVLLAAGAASLVIALLLSYALSSRTLRPVRQLAAAAEKAARGDYDTEVAIRRGDEVGKLAQAFDSLLSELREKKDMESYVSDLSRYLPDPDSQVALAAAQAKPMAVLAVELRRYARPKLGSQPEEALESFSRDLRRVSAGAAEHGGRLVAVSGHRALLRFEGPGAAGRAVAAASELIKRLGTPENAFDEAQPPLAAVTTGEVVTGTVVAGQHPSQALLGLPVQQLDSLLREASPGDLLLAPAVHEELGESFARAGLDVPPSRGVLSTQPLYILSGEVVDRLARREAGRPTLETAADEGAPTISGLGPGAVLGDRFEILAVLGAGGMGVVYKARDRELQDLVALKTLKRAAWSDREQLDGLKSELKLARRITHPNVLRTYDFGEVDGVSFISMEYVRGLTLRYLLQQTERLPYSAALRLARQLCAGLEAAHAGGVLHRDIKPENLIIDATGNAKLMDFGIARTFRGPSTSTTKTTPGTIIGTPHYLAPEIVQGQAPDSRADVYACGVLLYEMFTGQLPFSGTTPVQIVMAHVQEPPPAPSMHWPEIPPALEKIVLQCLAKPPAERYPDAGALLAVLNRLRA